MGSRDAAVYCNSQPDSICPSPGANPRLCNWQKPLHHNGTSSILYCWYDTEGLLLFHQLFAAHRPSYLTERFRTWIRQSKGLFHGSIVYSLCALTDWDLLTLFCFLNSGFLTAILSYRPAFRRCPWCNGYRRRKWTRQYEFKSWTRLIAFHIALIPLGKVWIQLFPLQLWVNSRAD